MNDMIVEQIKFSQIMDLYPHPHRVLRCIKTHFFYGYPHKCQPDIWPTRHLSTLTNVYLDKCSLTCVTRQNAPGHVLVHLKNIPEFSIISRSDTHTIKAVVPRTSYDFDTEITFHIRIKSSSHGHGIISHRNLKFSGESPVSCYPGCSRARADAV